MCRDLGRETLFKMLHLWGLLGYGKRLRGDRILLAPVPDCRKAATTALANGMVRRLGTTPTPSPIDFAATVVRFAKRLRSPDPILVGSRATRKLAAGFRDSYQETLEPYRDCPDERRVGVRRFSWSGQFR